MLLKCSVQRIKNQPRIRRKFRTQKSSRIMFSKQNKGNKCLPQFRHVSGKCGDLQAEERRRGRSKGETDRCSSMQRQRQQKHSTTYWGTGAKQLQVTMSKPWNAEIHFIKHNPGLGYERPGPDVWSNSRRVPGPLGWQWLSA